MIRHKAATRYARAAFDLAQEENNLEALRTDLRALALLLEQSKELTSFVSNYLIPEARRSETIPALFEGKLQATSYRFICYLEKKKRLGLLREICTAFEDFCYEHQGILKATIASAFPLTPRHLEEITQHLSRKHGKQIEPQTLIDASLIGGFRVQIGDLIEDYSLRNQLRALKERIVRA